MNLVLIYRLKIINPFRFAQLCLERKKGLLNLTIMCRSSFEIRGKSIFEKTVLATDNSSGEQLKITGNKPRFSLKNFHPNLAGRNLLLPIIVSIFIRENSRLHPSVHPRNYPLLNGFPPQRRGKKRKKETRPSTNRPASGLIARRHNRVNREYEYRSVA